MYKLELALNIIQLLNKLDEGKKITTLGFSNIYDSLFFFGDVKKTVTWRWPKTWRDEDSLYILTHNFLTTQGYRQTLRLLSPKIHFE